MVMKCFVIYAVTASRISENSPVTPLPPDDNIHRRRRELPHLSPFCTHPLTKAPAPRMIPRVSEEILLPSAFRLNRRDGFVESFGMGVVPPFYKLADDTG